MTNVFISWSGDLSKKLAEELSRWIPSVLQFAKPYFTPNDIEKGTKWGSEISQKLSETHIGIVCLTRENFERPWILFEAGALSKDIDASKVCSILFGMEPSDLSGPLTTFQTTQFEKRDFKKLLSTINETGGDQKLNQETFDRVFEMWWPQLQASVEKILNAKTKKDSKELRADRDILEEILALTRISARNRARYAEKHSLFPGIANQLCSNATMIVQASKFYKDLDLLEVSASIADSIAMIANEFPQDNHETKDLLSRLNHESSSARSDIKRQKELDEEIPF
ncbi:TIR domain-containing protein [Halocynthiibacter styelae]|uniref:TIR domain-containing protein n=1 Tax=Halocynthiibacter styelae TaxID=2761955 RepID=A0A8J7INZ9_9RHOB|nr:TIR domain-containing protein [Paenihalocynthiibacter styelae]MBI1492501.1 hypothetical protein [Paenihalocynthiibacter styelae]